MDNRKDVHDFLVSRRAKITPAQAGLPTYGDRRRVPGLRREEVASLAGVSFDYYARLERGNLSGVSDPVLESLARALRLDEAERAHLFDLARMAGTPARAVKASKPGPVTVRPSVAGILAGMTAIPAYVRSARMDILAANDLCYALYTGVLSPGQMPVNLARYVFLDHRSTGFYLEWDMIADDVVGTLRREVGRNPADRGLSDLVGELSTRSDAFAARWGRHNVRIHRTSRKRLHNTVVGDIELTGDALELPGDGLTLVAYTAEAGSHARDQLDLLASWAATERRPTPPAAPQPESPDRFQR